MNTMESIGATHYELASAKNFDDSNKRVILRMHKDYTVAYVACSEELSAELRKCDKSELGNKMIELGRLIIGEELEVLS